MTCFEVRALKNTLLEVRALEIIFCDSIDPIKPKDDSIIDAIRVPQKGTATIHTTRTHTHTDTKGKQKNRWRRPVVCGVNAGGLFVWHKYKNLDNL